jgi:acetyl-CoA synthetase
MATDSDIAWRPDEATLAHANVTAAMRSRGIDTYAEFHRWSVTDRGAFWEDAIARLGIVFRVPPERIMDPEGSVEEPAWLEGARLNIAESCFRHDPEKPAVVHGGSDGIAVMSRRDLEALTMRVARGFAAAGYRPGDRVAIAMPMTVEAVAAYLGIVWAGGVVVSIADSFAPDEIAMRLRITRASGVVTQDVVHRGGRDLPMYAKVVDAGAERAIVVDTGAGVGLHPGDLAWEAFLSPADPIEPVAAEPGAAMNFLFSSGTTGEPKAIPWTQLTPIKAAADGYYHQDIHPEDLVAWPTNLGWMMGPWLIYASLINGAALALYDDVPTGDGFGRFVQETGVTILGVVPSLVAAWRASGCMEGLDWSSIRLFSSTGEASNSSDMRYLMNLAGNKPVVEYCGGTEIGGAYITGTVVQPAVPAAFSTPTLGLDVRILDEESHPASSGELFLVPPSIGLSETLLNRDHHAVYYEDTPAPDGLTLRRHGDHMEALDGGYYRALGRVDDTMNLGGIKVSSAEIERVVGRVPGVAETAAIAVPPEGGGPGRLVVYVVLGDDAESEPERLRTTMQDEIRAHLNPLFRIQEVVPIAALPRTASAKVMRRSLRASYGRAAD